MIDLEFITRAENFFQGIDVNKKKNDYNKIYYRTSEGQLTARRGWKKRNRLRKKQWRKLTPEEKKEVRLFYKNRPPGYEVDHIIPVSKGGSYHISNLQYLTKEDNQRKFCKIPSQEELDEILEQNKCKAQ